MSAAGSLRAPAPVDDTGSVRRDDRVLQSGVVAAAVTALVCSVFAWLGVVNGDEGWYTLSARLVGEGRLPYRDFAFPQGPAYAYLLAPFVRVVPSVYTSRAVSVVCTVVSVGLLVAMARRVGGRWAAYASGVALLATIPSLPYWLSITKTYALSCLFLSAILFTLTTTGRPAVRYPLAAALAVGLTETRTTGFALAGLLIAALLWMAPDTTTRVRVVLASTAAALPFVVLVLLDWRSAHWALFEYHQLGAKGGGGFGQYYSRTFSAAHAWPGPTLLGVAALVVAIVNRNIRDRLRRRLDLVAVALGILIFAVLHEAAAHFFAEEYLAPLIAPAVVVSTVILVRAVAAARVADNRRRLSYALRGVLLVSIVFTAVTGGHSFYLGAPGWNGDPASIGGIVSCIKAHSSPHDAIFTLSLAEVVVASGRRPARDDTLGEFSYEDVSTKKANELKIINSETIAKVFRDRPTKLAVLTLDDIYETHRAGRFSTEDISNIQLFQAFQAYRPVCRATLTRPAYINVNRTVQVIVYERTATSR